MGPASETATAPAKVGWLTLLAIFLVALCLRQWPAEHGMPRRYVPDDHVVRNALGMARDKDPLPPMGTYSTYPYLVPYLLLPVYGAQYALGRAAGDWEDADEFGQRLLDEPGLAQVPARRLIGLFGALTALLVIAAGRSLGLGGGAAVAGWLTATSLLSVQLSTHGLPSSGCGRANDTVASKLRHTPDRRVRTKGRRTGFGGQRFTGFARPGSSREDRSPSSSNSFVASATGPQRGLDAAQPHRRRPEHKESNVLGW